MTYNFQPVSIFVFATETRTGATTYRRAARNLRGAIAALPRGTFVNTVDWWIE